MLSALIENQSEGLIGRDITTSAFNVCMISKTLSIAGIIKGNKNDYRHYN